MDELIDALAEAERGLDRATDAADHPQLENLCQHLAGVVWSLKRYERQQRIAEQRPDYHISEDQLEVFEEILGIDVSDADEPIEIGVGDDDEGFFRLEYVSKGGNTEALNEDGDDG